MQVFIKEHVQLTAPGNGEIVKIGSVQPAGGEMQITIATIDTSVVIRYDYSNDDFVTIVSGQEITFDANGIYTIPISIGYNEGRPVFVSEAGGTAATLDIQTRLFY